MSKLNYKPAYAVILLALSEIARPAAVTVTENFTLPAAQNNWTAVGACLTAGNGLPSTTATSVIPACASGLSGGKNGTTPDTSGNGALRLTSKANYQHGTIVYNSNFPTDQGIQATFTAYTYNGDSGGVAKLGADGISFFLLDGSLSTPAAVGATGGSLGYACSNSNAISDGIVGGYLGLGIDEYGNFSTGPGDSTATAGPAGYAPNSIVLRGGGSVNAATLASNGWGSYSASDIQSVCKTGKAKSKVDGVTRNVLDYPYITGVTLDPTALPLAKSGTTKRSLATPVTYKLKITPGGQLSLWYSYNSGSYVPVITNQNILDPTVSGPLPSSFRFGFSGGTGGSNNVHELTCFLATPATQANTSASVNANKGEQIQEGAQIYQSIYHADNWWGEVTANAVVLVNNVPTIQSVSAWDASCNLTGGSCSALANDSSGNPQSVTAQTARTIITSNGSNAGTAFTWAGLTTAQRNSLALSTDTDTSTTTKQNRLSFLRGDRTKEQPAGNFRQRTGVLSDITDSSPAWVGYPKKGYGATWTDSLYSSATNPESSYLSYISTYATRTNVVYVGANDGMLHGFRAGSYDTSGNFVSTNNDGYDLLDYVPATTMANMAPLSDPLYAHNYFVNATPGTGDLYYNNAWHTWVVGGLGNGGKAVYALDVTDPTQFSENNAATLVKGEWTDAIITSLNGGTALGSLGNTYGTPMIRRMHNGQWAVIFGNGLNASGNAGVYIMLVNPGSGAITPRWLSTGKTSASAGISYVSSADYDNDDVIDYLYAGDTAGNVWRFDVTSSNVSDWAVSTYGGTTPTPLFTATNSSGTAQPITTQIITSVLPDAKNTTRRALVMFATGQRTPFTSTSGDVYATGTQTVYGVWDWDMGSWDNGRTTASSVTIPAAQTSLLKSTSTTALTLGRSSLTAQTSTTVAATNSTLAYRTLSNNAICWSGTSTCTTAGSNTKFGWYYDMPVSTEQVIYNPVLSDGALELNTTIPPVDSTASCTVSLPTGWTMVFNPYSGGTFSKPFLTGIASDSTTLVQGAQTNMSGSPAPLTVAKDDGTTVSSVVGHNPGGGTIAVATNPQTQYIGQRITWKETQ